jgi:hypothetical protein
MREVVVCSNGDGSVGIVRERRERVVEEYGEGSWERGICRVIRVCKGR